MIIFHEGLPGSGKSYEAMTHHVLPMLKQGRKVFARIDGADDPACRGRVAELAGLTAAEVDQLWHHIREEDVQRVFELVEDNSFVVIDEAQNHWPSARKPLSPEMTKAVAEHRHRGIDVLLMGQLVKDVHPLWRGRVDQLVCFNKLSAIGAEKRYSIDVQKATRPGKFESVKKTVGKYDPALFGMYKTANSDSVSLANYKDARATIWAGWGFKFGIPVMGVVAVWGAFAIWRYFHPAPAPAPLVAKTPTTAVQQSQSQAQQYQAPPRATALATPAVAGQTPTFAGFVRALNDQYRPRLGYYAAYGKVERGSIEWWEGTTLRERFSITELRANGVVVTVNNGVAWVAGTWATAWKPPEEARPGYGAQAGNGLAATTSGAAGKPM